MWLSLSCDGIHNASRLPLFGSMTTAEGVIQSDLESIVWHVSRPMAGKRQLFTLPRWIVSKCQQALIRYIPYGSKARAPLVERDMQSI